MKHTYINRKRISNIYWVTRRIRADFDYVALEHV